MTTEENKKPVEHDDGVYFNMPLEEYLDDPALGASDIVNVIISPLTYWANSHLNPARPEREETDATKFGTLLHTAILEPEKFNVAVKPADMSFSTKAGKEWRTDQALQGKEIITDKQNRELTVIRMAIEASGLAAELEGGIAEVSYFWTDPSGHRCKIRIDKLQKNRAFDLKTYANMMQKDLETSIAHAVAYGRYNIKSRWYDIGIGHMIKNFKLGKDQKMPDGFWLDPEPKEFPHWYCFLEKGGVPNVTVRQFKERDPNGQRYAYWQAAENAVQYATNTFAACLEEFGTEKPWIRQAYLKAFGDEEFTAARWILEE